MFNNISSRYWLRAFANGISFAALGLGIMVCWPPRTRHLRSRPQPTHTYAEAIARFAALRARDDRSVNEACYSQLLDHGASTNLVVVLLHGLTNCPIQCAALGKLLHDAGHTVLIPRLPHNGLANRRTNALRNLRATELTTFGDDVVDIATGLGTHVCVFGLSAGALIAAWIAQHRADVSRVIIAAPALGIGPYHLFLEALLRNILLRMPNVMMDDSLKEVATKPEYTYVRKVTRSLGELMLLGEHVLREARWNAPAACDVLVMTNAADVTINNHAVYLLAERWKRHPGTHIEQFEFGADEQLGHDFVDPRQKTARTALVYPLVQHFIERT